ncbi:MAG: hypothetical protein H7257_01765 [Taibaiella sp.]|nr:hypothetical protein [Taibaiella sp.]
MEQDEEIIAQIWQYVDGDCSVEDSRRIARLVATDEQWAALYAEVLSFNATVAAHLEAEQPSLRFTKNVMETIGATQVLPSPRGYVNPFVIKGIAAFLLLALVVVTGFAVYTTDLSAATLLVPAFTLPHLPVKGIFTPSVLYSVIGANIIFALLLGDVLLRRKWAARGGEGS